MGHSTCIPCTATVWRVPLLFPQMGRFHRVPKISWYTSVSAPPLCPTFKSRLWDKFPFFRLLGVHIPRQPGTVSRFSLVCPTSLLQKVGQIREPAGYLLCPSPCWRLGPRPPCLQGIASKASQSPVQSCPGSAQDPGRPKAWRASVQDGNFSYLDTTKEIWSNALFA